MVVGVFGSYSEIENRIATINLNMGIGFLALYPSTVWIETEMSFILINELINFKIKGITRGKI